MPNGPLGFEDGTRRRTKILNTIPFYDGQPQTLRLDNVGYLSRIRLQHYIQVQATGAVAFAGDALVQGARAAIPRIIFGTNQQANIVACSSHGLNLLSYLESPGHYSSDQLSDEQSGPITAAGTTNYWFETIVPVAFNDAGNYTLGLLNLQNDDVSADLRIEHAVIKSLFADPTVITAASGYTIVEIEYYEVPDAAQYTQPPLNNLVTVSEDVQPITIGTGEHVYNIPRGNVLAQIVHQLTEGNSAITYNSPVSPDGKLQTYELRMQGATTDSKSYGWLKSHEDRRRYGRTLPAGSVVNDFSWDIGRVGQFELGFQMVDTAQYTQLQLLFALTGTSPTSTKLRTVRREIVRLY